MSSSRKRAAILRAQAETDAMSQQLKLTQHHYNVLKGVAEVLAARVETSDLAVSALSEQIKLEKAEIDRLTSIVNEVRAWIVCAAITTPEDMMQHAESIIEITTPKERQS